MDDHTRLYMEKLDHKVNQKIAIFGFEIWKPGIWKVGLGTGIENLCFETQIWKPSI